MPTVGMTVIANLDSAQDDRDVHLHQIQQQVSRGEYRVNALAVAEAMLRRLLDGPELWSPPPRLPQDECS